MGDLDTDQWRAIHHRLLTAHAHLTARRPPWRWREACQMCHLSCWYWQLGVIATPADLHYACPTCLDVEKAMRPNVIVPFRQPNTKD